MYDENEDGELDIIDLSNLRDNIPVQSELYKEIEKLINCYMELNRNRSNHSGLSEIEFYRTLKGESVLALVIVIIKYRNLEENY